MRRAMAVFSAGGRVFSVLALCGTLLVGPVLAARPELELGADKQRLKIPAYLEQRGLRSAEPRRRPAAEPSSDALAAWERLRENATGTWRVDWDASKGTPVMAHGGAVGPYPGTPEAAARAFLRDYADLFNLRDMGELRHDSTVTSRGGHRVSFVQHHRGLPVIEGTILVLVDESGQVRMASGGFQALPRQTPSMNISADWATRSVLRHVDPRAEMARQVSPGVPPSGVPSSTAVDYVSADVVPDTLLGIGKARPAWYPTAEGFRPVWIVDVALADLSAEFRTFVDAETAEPIDAVMRSTSTHETIRVYTINPDRTPLTDEVLRDVDKPNVGGPLDGPFTDVDNEQAARIANAPYNHSTDPNDPTVDLNFDEQNVFYHSNLIRQFFVDTNGGPVIGSVNLNTDPLDAVVHRVDGGNLDVDNASYFPALDLARFGHGSFHTGVVFGLRDLALEDSIVYHEYSHRINDNIAGFTGSSIYNGALNEAFADFWATALGDEKYIGEFANADPEVGDDSGGLGLSGFLRSMDNDRTFSQICDNPFTTNGCEVHSDGEIFAGILWDIRQAMIDAVGKTQGTGDLNQIVLQALFNMSGGGAFDNDTFIEGRDALLTAESTLFGGTYECVLWRAFAAREMGDGATDGETGGAPSPTLSTALPAACSGAATVAFSKPLYNCSAPDSGTLTVSDPDGGAVTSITVSTDGGDSETFTLAWTAGVATTAAFDVEVGSVSAGNGVVEVAAQGELVLATYADTSPAVSVFGSSTVDCTPDIRLLDTALTISSCSDNDPFLDGGESAVVQANLALDLQRDVSSNFLNGLTLTLVSGNADVTVVPPATITPAVTVSGTRLLIVGTWGIEGDSGVGAGNTADLDILVGGPGYTGSESPIAFTQILEQDLSFVPQTAFFDFVSGEQEFFTAANGAGGTESWVRDTFVCVTPPSGGYWKSSLGVFCGNYVITDNTWLVSPFVQIQPTNATYASRLTHLRFQHLVDFGPAAGAAPFIESDRLDLAGSLEQLPAFYDSTDNGANFVQEEIDLTTGIPSGVDLAHGWVRFRWLFIANSAGTGGAVDRGWFVDDVEIGWEEPSVVADANSSASCAPSVSLEFDSATVLDGITAGVGNADGIIDPGESINLPVSLLNVGNGAAQNITGVLSSDQPGIITVSDDTATFTNVLPQEVRGSIPDHFTFDVDAAAVCGTLVNFTVVLDHNGVAAASTVNFTLRIGQTVPVSPPIFLDDFESNSGAWTVNFGGGDTATTGQWERVNPTQNYYGEDAVNNNETQPGDDFDPGTATGQCFITQNGGAPFNLHDVDDGTTTLTTQSFDLTGFMEPQVSYARWVYNRDGTPADAFEFQISNNNGADWTTVESVSDFNGIPFNPVTNVWTEVELRIEDHVTLTDQMRFRFLAQDQSGQIIEAAVDKFQLFDIEPVCTLGVPPEVSPPGSGVPLRATRSGGSIDLSWEATVAANSYRIVSGALADLQIDGGVVSTNSDPISCGIVGINTTVPEPAGSVFFLVQGEGAGGVGTAGPGRDPGSMCP